MWNKWIEMQSNELLSSTTTTERINCIKTFEGSQWMKEEPISKLHWTNYTKWIHACYLSCNKLNAFEWLFFICFNLFLIYFIFVSISLFCFCFCFAFAFAFDFAFTFTLLSSPTIVKWNKKKIN